jgi:hypothetical protein
MTSGFFGVIGFVGGTIAAVVGLASQNTTGNVLFIAGIIWVIVSVIGLIKG